MFCGTVSRNLTFNSNHLYLFSDPDAPGGTPVMQQPQVFSFRNAVFYDLLRHEDKMIFVSVSY